MSGAATSSKGPDSLSLSQVELHLSGLGLPKGFSSFLIKVLSKLTFVKMQYLAVICSLFLESSCQAP
jgi:hypothetical protein